MAKIRIHELAKKLNMNSKDLVARLRQMGYSVKNHMSTIDEKEIAKIKKNLKSNDNKNMKDNKSKKEKKDAVPASKPEIKEKDFRKRAQVRKDELRQKKEQNHRYTVCHFESKLWPQGLCLYPTLLRLQYPWLVFWGLLSTPPFQQPARASLEVAQYLSPFSQKPVHK
jgi:hypothetical protein